MQTKEIKPDSERTNSQAGKQNPKFIPRQDAEKIMSLARERERAFSCQNPMLTGRCRI